jgi:hypothetical protein
MHYAIYPNKFIYMVARNRAQFPKSVQPFVMSEEELLKKPMEYLHGVFNKNCQIPVREFTTQEEAVERTSQFLKDYFHLQENIMAKRQPNPENAETTAAETAATEQPAKAERASRIPKDTVIKLLATSNPKRSGSAAHTRFAFYQDGMTVGQFLEAGGTMADINFDAAKKFISLETNGQAVNVEESAEAEAAE